MWKAPPQGTMKLGIQIGREICFSQGRDDDDDDEEMMQEHLVPPQIIRYVS